MKDLEPGLLASCFVGSTPGTLSFKRKDPFLLFEWGRNSAWEGGPLDQFSIRWTGYLRVPKKGSYTFRVLSDDGFRVSIDGKDVVERWRPRQSISEVFQTIEGSCILEKGDHPIVIDYYEMGGQANFKFWWREGAEGRFEVVSTGALFSAPDANAVAIKKLEGLKVPPLYTPGLQATYYLGQELGGVPAGRSQDLLVDFRWRNGPAWPGGPPDNFSIRWSGSLYVHEQGVYTLSVLADDGARLFLDGRNVLERWPTFGFRTPITTSIELAKGFHPLVLEYHEGGGVCGISLAWKPPGAA